MTTAHSKTGGTEGPGAPQKGRLLYSGDIEAISNLASRERKERRDAVVLGVFVFGFLTFIATMYLSQGPPGWGTWCLGLFLILFSLFLLFLALLNSRTRLGGVFNAYEDGFDVPERFNRPDRVQMGIRRRHEIMESRLEDRRGWLASPGPLPIPESSGMSRPAAQEVDLGLFVPYDAVMKIRFEARGHRCLVTLHVGPTIRLEDDFGFEAYRFVCETLQRKLGMQDGPDFDLTQAANEATELFHGDMISRAELDVIWKMERKVNGRFQ